MPTVLIADAQFLFPSDQCEHVRAWKWHCYVTGNYHYNKFNGRIVYGSRG